jgi:uracil-DNA glycosylase
MTHISSPSGYTDAACVIGEANWGQLDFFTSGTAANVAARVDARVAGGAEVLPLPEQVFAALELTPPEAVRAVVLGQDPYPTPGHAHGLAFSVADHNRRLPASLRTVYQSLELDLGIARKAHGNLTSWAKSGVLLLNVALTVEAGRANAHKDFGWDALATEIMTRLNEGSAPVVFMLWGNFAQKAAPELDETRHCVIRCAHPSPLARGSGLHHKFVAAKPFAQARDWCVEHGLAEIDWRL